MLVVADTQRLGAPFISCQSCYVAIMKIMVLVYLYNSALTRLELTAILMLGNHLLLVS